MGCHIIIFYYYSEMILWLRTMVIFFISFWKLCLYFYYLLQCITRTYGNNNWQYSAATIIPNNIIYRTQTVKNKNKLIAYITFDSLARILTALPPPRCLESISSIFIIWHDIFSNRNRSYRCRYYIDSRMRYFGVMCWYIRAVVQSNNI